MIRMLDTNCQTYARDNNGAGVQEWTPAGVWILGWSRNRSRSPYFRFGPEQEQELTLRTVQETVKLFQGPIKIYVMMFVVVKRNGIKWEMFSDQGSHISQKCDTGWAYQEFDH